MSSCGRGEEGSHGKPISAVAPTHPVAVTLQRLATLDSWLSAHLDRPSGVFRTARRGPRRRAPSPDSACRALADRRPSDDRHIPARRRRVARGRSTDRRPPRRPARAGRALLGRRFCALADDPAASHPDAVKVNESQLLVVLRERICQTLDGVVAALRPWPRRSPRIRGELISDTVASARHSAGAELGDEADGRRLADDPLDGSPRCVARATGCPSPRWPAQDLPGPAAPAAWPTASASTATAEPARC